MKKLLTVIIIILVVAIGMWGVWQVIRLLAYFVGTGIVCFAAGWFSHKYYFKK